MLSPPLLNLLGNAAEHSFVASCLLLMIAVSVATLEYFSVLREFGPSGAFSWRILGTRSPRPSNRLLRNARETLMSTPGVAAVLSVRLASVALLGASIALSNKSLPVYALAGLLITGMVLAYRCAFGTDGSDQMSNVVAAGLLVAAIPLRSDEWKVLGFAFIALQSCLSYCTAGIAKVISPVWRDGSAIYKVMNTSTYGNLTAASFLKGSDVSCIVVCWGVMAFEILFPFVLLCPLNICLYFFLVGLCFHLGNAVLMGLNTFLWSFMATYPAILFCNIQLHKWLGF